MQAVRDEARELISQALEADADADEDDKYEWLAKHSARFLGEQSTKRQKPAPMDAD